MLGHCQLTSGGVKYPMQIEYLVSRNCIMPLCNTLIDGDNKIIAVALDGLANILKVGEMKRILDPENNNRYALLIEEGGGLETIQRLQSHDNEDIYEKAYMIVTQYFGEDEIDMHEAQGAFAFDGAPTVPEGGFHF